MERNSYLYLSRTILLFSVLFLSFTSGAQVLEDLELVTSQTHGASVMSVAWCEGCDYLAIGGNTGDGGSEIRVYKSIFSEPPAPLNQHGFVLGNNGELEVDEYSYFDYVGLANDVCPTLTETVPTTTIVDPCDCDSDQMCSCSYSNQYIKRRNPSAFVVDGYHEPKAKAAFIKLNGHSAIVFRSGINCCGTIENDISTSHPFTVAQGNMTRGQGEIVFDVEGKLIITGSVNQGTDLPTKIEILSSEVAPTGGPVLYNGTETNFPDRLFNNYYYNKASFFINNTMNLCHTWLVHTDQNHAVYEKDDMQSEPTYVGGETFKILAESQPPVIVPRPKIVYYNSRLYVHMSVAYTGVDQLIPNGYICVDPLCGAECEEGEIRCPCCGCCFPNTCRYRSDGDGACSCSLDSVSSIIDDNQKKFISFNDLETGPESCPSCGCCFSDPYHYRSTKGVVTKVACSCSLDSVPSTTCDDNDSKFVFFYNGFATDSGTGRQMILGTYIGSLGCDCCTIVDENSHLDVMQCSDLPDGLQTCDTKLHKLTLLTTPNNGEIVNGLPPSGLEQQYSIQTIYLGHESNISVGTHVCQPSDEFDPHTTPTFLIDGNFFSFESRGGPTGSPETTSVTGVGGIFVDWYGTIDIASNRRANISTMVTKSGSGYINLPKSQVFFDIRVGAADWQLSLVSGDTVIVPVGNKISDYTLNWLATTKAYENDNFRPYTVRDFELCDTCTVDQKNVGYLPVVQGTIEQLQIKESRLGDPAHVIIDGGWVQELVFLSGYNSSEAPVGVMILKNNGRLGLGSLHRDVDSLEASVVLGINGVTLIADGNSRVDLNEDIIVNNICHILKGPNFSTSDRFVISSDEDRMIFVRSGGKLDLSTFTEGYTVEFTGNVKIVLEPGAQIVLGGGTVIVSEYASIYCDPLIPSALVSATGTTLTALDNVRVKFGGTGTMLFEDQARVVINKGAFVGIEAVVCKDRDGNVESTQPTDLTWLLLNDAKVLIGDGVLGGSLQVGNSQNLDETVTFSVTIYGRDAGFVINSQGFLGLGVGMIDKTTDTAGTWTIAPTHNVAAVTLDIQSGKFVHNQVYPGNDTYASLFAIGPSAENSALFSAHLRLVIDEIEANVSPSTLQGGGNFVVVPFDSSPMQPGNMNDATDTCGASSLCVGLLASKPLINTPDVEVVAAQTWFNTWKTHEIFGTGLVASTNGRADAGPGLRNQLRIGYVDHNKIARVQRVKVIGAGGITTSQEASLEIGAVVLDLVSGTTYPRPILVVWELN
ncbi:hypothetical protein E3J79_03625 [Candidatus Dependentiae bacterium]|nr:MAG: hypothetical protein E3J79_03625 [Candidatus Dependentiae bacterium]